MDTNTNLESITKFMEGCIEACDAAAIKTYGPNRVRMVLICELLDKNKKDYQVQALGNTPPKDCVPMLMETLFMLTEKINGFRELLHEFAQKTQAAFELLKKKHEN